MTEQQIIETLATKVMGWVPIPPRPNGPPEVFPAFCFPIYRDIKDGCIVAHKDADGVIDTAHWNPIQNIADAWQLVDKIGPFVYRKSPVENGDYYHVAKVFYQGYWYSEEGATVQDAICRVVLKAYGIDLTHR
ncbi:BC1872 family protein [Brevibacillus laterosporus]|uniref:BC1872 family protein n=1 Tax=Brevibacillus laterosporus TaxID=1465 RepID=UPI000E6CD0D6|nr:hypothetical protein [Brevibacillus laterosporus]AYB39989.1 hypothetical protein D5F52_17925 [Brevibacillus laterosporus]MBM7108387.1 hypothetical protein [Brevibacillus laterosporus]